MIQSRFATYYQNNPETKDLSLIVKNSKTASKSSHPSKTPSKKELALAKKQRADERDYLRKSVEMKLELAFLYISRSNADLQSL